MYGRSNVAEEDLRKYMYILDRVGIYLGTVRNSGWI